MNEGTGLRVAFAGAGLMSRFHLDGWAEVEGADVVAICDPVAERAEGRAAEYGIPAVYTDFARMLDDARPDAVDIATPVETHADLVRIAADRGVHACSQKPVTPTVAEAEGLIADVGERIRFMVHENFRWRPHYLQMGEWLREGRIGRVTHARMTVRSPGLAPPADGSTPPDLVRQPYLATFRRLIAFELLIHQLDVLRSLLGEFEVVSVEMDRINKDLVGEDVAIVVMRGEDGMTAVVDGSMSAPGYPARPSDRLELIGTADTHGLRRRQAVPGRRRDAARGARRRGELPGLLRQRGAGFRGRGAHGRAVLDRPAGQSRVVAADGALLRGRRRRSVTRPARPWRFGSSHLKEPPP